jgi:hypothetical protein
MATLQVDGNGNQVVDEIKEYIDGCYIGPTQACWHMYELPMHGEKPTVYCLPVHLQNEQMVFFDDNDDLEVVENRATAKDTHLMGWFKANQTYPAAHQYTYQDMPPHFTWKKVTSGHPGSKAIQLAE